MDGDGCGGVVSVPPAAAAVKLVGDRLSVLCTGDRLPSESLLWLDGGVGGSAKFDDGSNLMLTFGKTRWRSVREEVEGEAASTMVGCLSRL